MEYTKENGAGTRLDIEILTTDSDKNSNDIAEMSNFFKVDIELFKSDLETYSLTYHMERFPVLDARILTEIIEIEKIAFKNSCVFVPDFSRLPTEITDKLRRGTYRIKEIEQPDGNLRAIITDKKGIKVKDVAFKKVVKTPETIDVFQNIITEIQLHQIYAMLSDVVSMQKYQIQRDRDRDLFVPFLDAREYILRAQNALSRKDQIQNLSLADEKLITVQNSICSDIGTISKEMAQTVAWSFLPIWGRRRKQLENVMDFVVDDLVTLEKAVGLHIQVCHYLGNASNARRAMNRLEKCLRDLCEKELDGKGHTAASLLHAYYPYSNSNRNCWYYFARKVKATPALSELLISGQEICLVSVEDENDAEHE